MDVSIHYPEECLCIGASIQLNRMFLSTRSFVVLRKDPKDAVSRKAHSSNFLANSFLEIYDWAG